MSFILLNGPPGCGKDTAAEILAERNGWVHRAFKDELYRIAILVSGVDREWAMHLFTHRVRKENICKEFVIDGEPVSPRKYLQHISETVVKPLLGEEYFGHILELYSKTDQVTVVSDSGFVDEAVALADGLEREVIVIPIYREGCTFEGDTRDYLPPNESYRITEAVHNDGTLEELYTNIMRNIKCVT